MKGVGGFAVGQSCQLNGLHSGATVGGLRADVRVVFVCLLCLSQILSMWASGAARAYRSVFVNSAI